VLTVPRTAVVSDEGEKAVFLLENGHALRRPIQVGAENEDRVAVLTGLKPGDRVIIDAGPVTDGQPVRLAGPNV
jgi:HlyD family secretion protein